MNSKGAKLVGYVICVVGVLATLGTSAPSQADKTKRVWTDPAAARSQDPDFSVQGEYGSVKPGAVAGVQVVALGQGRFEVYSCIATWNFPRTSPRPLRSTAR